MMVYLLKMIACSAIFYGLYQFFLSKEKTLVFNRFYLLGGFIASFLIPLITITRMVDAPKHSSYVEYTAMDTYKPAIETSVQDYLIYLAFIILVGISTFLLFRFIRNLVIIRRKINSSKQFVFNGATLALSRNATVPYSFLNTIFLSEEEYEQGKIEPEVLTHELAHVNQKHSYDILLVEILQIFCWFNPILYLYKHAIKINHELLADATVVKEFGNVHNYQCILLQRATSHYYALELSSSFNYFTTKKRLIMLQKSFSKKRVFIAALAVIPTLALALLAGCNQTEKQKDATAPSNKNDSVAINTRPVPPPPTVENAPVPPPPPPKVDVVRMPPPIVKADYGSGATTAELEKYESVVSKIKEGKDQSRGRLSNGDYRVIYGIYDKMNKEQRKLSSKVPVVHFSPPIVEKDKQKITPPIIRSDFGLGVTDAEMKAYEEIIKKGKTETPGNVNYEFGAEDFKKAYAIFIRMNKEQQKAAGQIPSPPPPMEPMKSKEK